MQESLSRVLPAWVLPAWHVPALTASWAVASIHPVSDPPDHPFASTTALSLPGPLPYL